MPTPAVAASADPVRVLVDPPLADAFNGWRTTATSIRLLPLAPGTVYYTWDTPHGVWKPATGEIIAPPGKHVLYTRLLLADGSATPISAEEIKVDFRATGRPTSTLRPTATPAADPVGGAAVVRVTAQINPTAGARLIRLGGVNRYATSMRISQDAFAQADTVIIATGADFADALCASGLAGCVEGPVLLTDPKSLSSPAAADIKRLKATRAIIVGGPVAVSPNVANQLKELGVKVERLGGSNRYETATIIGSRVLSYGHSGGRVFVARGDDFADALTLGPLAYSARAPLVLVTPKTVPSATRSYLNANHFSSGCIAGGTVAVSPAVFSAIDGLVGTVARLGGSSRYSTAVSVAAWGVGNGLASYEAIGIATGTGFADALCGGVAIGRAGGVVFLTLPGTLPTETANAIAAIVGEVMDTQIYGGEVAIYPGVFDRVANILR